ncbi:hypothetical protein G7046_g6318 [Stylonectria norvegica]|nr:hypothetical protein G7046_g6318 [Stylonectria norvegica]
MPPASNCSDITAREAPRMPFWLHAIRGSILTFSILALITAAYHRHHSAAGLHRHDPTVLLMFVAVFTLIILTLMIAIELCVSRLYVRFVFVANLAFVDFLWLPAWVWSATAVRTSYHVDKQNTFSGPSQVVAAVSGAIVWVLIIAFVIFFVRASRASSTRRPSETDVEADLEQYKLESVPSMHKRESVQSMQTASTHLSHGRF